MENKDLKSSVEKTPEQRKSERDIQIRNAKESIAKVIFIIAACASIFAVVMICIFLLSSGIPTMREIGVVDFLFGTVWNSSTDTYGILPMILGSIYTTAGAILLGVPIGLLTAIFLAKFCPEKIYKYLKPAVNLLAGIPSIIYGFFGLMVIVPAIRNVNSSSGASLLAGSIVLAIMILPTIIGLSETAIRAVSETYYEGALALGDTHERTVMKVMVPSAKSGIMASIVLGVGRAIGETMALVMVAGNSPIIPTSIFDRVRTLTSNIVLDIAYASGLHEQALLATGVVLFIFILIINTCFSLIKGKQEEAND